MVRNELVRVLQARPFQPFRLYVSDGNTYDVRHPEMLMVTKRSAIVGILQRSGRGSSSSDYPEIERCATVDLLHVTQLEQLQQHP